MAYKPKRGGHKHRAIIAAGHSATRQQRDIIRRIITAGPSQAELFQLLTQLALLSSQIDETLDDLEKYEDKDG